MFSPYSKYSSYSCGIVESDDAEASSMLLLFETSGFDVKLYRTATEYLNQHEKQHDCLIVDHRLSDMLGEKLCHLLVARNEPTPVVLVIATPWEPDINIKSLDNIHAIARKPFVGDNLVSLVQSVINRTNYSMSKMISSKIPCTLL